MFYRVGDAEAISLDSESIVSRIAFHGGQVTLTFRDGKYSTLTPAQADHEGYVQFIMSCPLLVSELQAQTLRNIQSEYADPFFEEMPRTLFVLFQAFPGANALEMHLDETGAGSLWTKGSDAYSLLEWDDFNEGLRCLKTGERREWLHIPKS